MFAPSRNQLGQVADYLIDLQQCQCFYCGKSLKNSKYAVDHFIPWSLYPADTGHNFVLADENATHKKVIIWRQNNFCNSGRSGIST
jgi:5-methylcytosine-specific restriction endonuclease McrA